MSKARGFVFSERKVAFTLSPAGAVIPTDCNGALRFFGAQAAFVKIGLIIVFSISILECLHIVWE